MAGHAAGHTAASSAEIIARAVEVMQSDSLDQAQKISFLNLLNIDNNTLGAGPRQVLKRFTEGSLAPDKAVEMILQFTTQMQQQHQADKAGGGKGKRNRSDDGGADSGSGMGGGAQSLGGSVGGGRATKAARWDLNAIRPGEELSFLADTTTGEDAAMLDMIQDQSFLRAAPPTGLGRNVSGGSLQSIGSEAVDVGGEMPDFVGFKRSHEVLRSKLRRGERLQEAMFEKVEECGKSQDGAKPRTSLFTVGGSGRVFKMRLLDDPNGVVCAMKTVPLHLQAGELDAFEQDVRLAYGHQHPNIMPLYDVCIKRMEGTSQDLWQLCIYMHYADCGSLSTLAGQNADGRLPVLFVTGVAAQMLEALSFLHNTAHVCHRDLKPSNILVRSDGRVMLQDFGNSRQLGGTFHSMRTYVGCQVYMSPERINGVQYTTKSDVWALALILMECLVGRFPYDCDVSGEGSMYELLERIVDDQVPVHLLHETGVPEMVVLFLKRTLLKDQESRPASEELLCSKHEARKAARGEFPMCYSAGDGIGIVCTASEDPEEKVRSARMFALPGAAQRAVEAGLIELAIKVSEAAAESMGGFSVTGLQA